MVGKRRMGPRLDPKDREAVSKRDLENIFSRLASTPPNRTGSGKSRADPGGAGRRYRLARKARRGVLILLHARPNFRLCNSRSRPFAVYGSRTRSPIRTPRLYAEASMPLREYGREVISIVMGGERLLRVAQRSRPFPPDIRS